jgi:SAM-dependent methyltransferase
MNYGFIPLEGAALPLEPEDEPSRLCIQLYRCTVSSVDLTGAQVLEVGSGRGGGASYIARYFKPARVTGADFAPAAVALCQRRHQGVPRLGFAVGNAERLPFADASFDVVINVESSHCYGHVDRFFSEVARVLRPGGTFLYTDFRPAAGMAAVEAQLAAVPEWKLLESEDLTGGVVAALEADDARKRKLIAEAVPPRLQHLFGELPGWLAAKCMQASVNGRSFIGGLRCGRSQADFGARSVGAGFKRIPGDPFLPGRRRWDQLAPIPPSLAQ